MAKARVIDDDDDDDDDLPRRKKRRPVDDDDDDDDERPVSKKKKPRVVVYDDDDDDDRPVKKKTKKGKKRKPAKNNTMLFLIIGGVALLGFLSCAGLGGWYFFLRDSPEIVVKNFISAVENKNYGKIYDLSDNSTRSQMAEFARRTNKYTGKSDREMFIAMLEDEEKQRANRSSEVFFKDGKPTVTGSTITGDTATVTIKFPTGKTDTIRCLKQDGSWRINR